MNNWNSVNLLDCGYSDLFGVFLAPVLVNNNCANNDRKDKKCAKYYIKKIRSLHLFYTSLSRMIPKIIRTKNNANPGISRANLIPDGETIGPKISIAHTNLAISYIVFAKPFRWFLSSFIAGNVAKTKLFVKFVGSLPGTFDGGVRSFWNKCSKNYFGGYGICGGDAPSNLFGVIFTPVRVKYKTAKYQGDNNPDHKKNGKLVHIYSPLSIIYPNVKNVMNKIIPATKADKVILSGEAILPTIKAIKIACDKLKNTLATFSLRLFVGFIKNIIPQTKLFLKFVGSLPDNLVVAPSEHLQ